MRYERHGTINYHPNITFILALFIPSKKQINTRLTNLFLDFKLNILPQAFLIPILENRIFKFPFTAA